MEHFGTIPDSGSLHDIHFIEFINRYCHKVPKARESLRYLYSRYIVWHIDYNGYNSIHIPLKEFMDRVLELDGVTLDFMKQSRGKRDYPVFTGIQLRLDSHN